MILLLDSEAVWSLCGRKTARLDQVIGAIDEANSRGFDIVVPAVVLAELYRTATHSAAVDSLLSRRDLLRILPTDLAMARIVGEVLSRARAGSALMVDAHLVAAAVIHGSGVILTGDVKDLRRLAAPFRDVRVVQI